MRQIAPLAAVLALLAGCAGSGGAIPVVDNGRPVSNEDMQTGAGRVTPATPVTSAPRDSGVVVMVPNAEGGSSQVESYPLDSQPALQTGSGVSSVPSSGNGSLGSNVGSSVLQGDEQLDGPVLALLTTARQQESNGDLNGANASLERAMRIAPREPQVLYRLAQVRLGQGDAAQAEQLARRGLSYASGRPELQAGLWELVAQAREQQGDSTGAEQARQRAKVSS
ncbi:MAG: tetratricopeptide repeat protein [Halopseudomonas sp.]|uniref:tetratricopeptide repeat protein n=1 Tax=Halopseudomonas sp. TaxID=2901191 RepID=UPI0030039905